MNCITLSNVYGDMNMIKNVIATD